MKKQLFTLLILVLPIITQAYNVTNLGDAGVGSGLNGDLRYCINQANSNPGPDVIDFMVAGTITLTSSLPTCMGPISINGNTAPGYAVNAPTVEINANGVAGWCFLFNVAASSNSTIRGLVLNRAQFTNVEVNGVNTITIEECFIGTTMNGLAAAASNPAFGVRVYNSDNITVSNCVIGGHTQHGIFVSDGSDNFIVKSSKIGCNKNGTAAISNQIHGILLNTNCLSAQIGGPFVSDRNIISGNLEIGVQVWGASHDILIQNNYIGVQASGNSALANGIHGVNIENCNSADILDNVVSGNAQYGILIKNCNNHIVKGNKLGTNAAGTAAIPNVLYAGISFENSSNNTLGGTSASESNVCSGNGDVGIRFQNSSNNIIIGNKIGTDISGNAAIGNAVMGIFATTNCHNNTIGGNTAAHRNIISANGKYGIQYNDQCNDLLIQGNYIGTNASGAGLPSVMGNGENGVIISNNCLRTKFYSNVISGNGRLYDNTATHPNGTGIFIVAGCTDGEIKGNYIGVQADGSAAMGNAENGVVIFIGCDRYTIGGTAVSDRNIISSNGTKFAGIGQGLVINQSHSATIIGNYIGTDISGTLNRGNRQSGIITIFSNSDKIGMALSGAGNLIVNNGELGIHLVGGVGTTVYNNYIGTNASDLNMGNASGGIFIHGVGGGSNGSTTLVGGIAAMEANVIAYSKGTGPIQFGNGYGVGVAHNDQGRDNAIRGNSIYCNTGLGIDLNRSGVFGGASNGIGNNNKSAPIISIATSDSIGGSGTNGEIIHIYSNDPACGCEGKVYLGNVTVTGGQWGYRHNLGLTDPNSISATATNSTGSTSEFICPSSILPLQFVSILASPAKEGVWISWTTLHELNTQNFVIEKSLDGESFYSIGSMEAKGNSAVINMYRFLDQEIQNQKCFYRIREIDQDGSEWYSEIVFLTNDMNSIEWRGPDAEGNFMLIKPNSHETAYVRIVDALGREIRTLSINEEISILNTEDLAPGVYLFEVNYAHTVIVYKHYKN